jgi:transcriptional regulator with XRE-family HTH domain
MKKTSLAVRLGRAIRARREAMHVSQDKLADRIKMHRAYYSAIERGEKNVTLPTLLRIAEGLGVRMADILGDLDV